MFSQSQKVALTKAADAIRNQTVLQYLLTTPDPVYYDSISEYYISTQNWVAIVEIKQPLATLLGVVVSDGNNHTINEIRATESGMPRMTHYSLGYQLYPDRDWQSQVEDFGLDVIATQTNGKWSVK